MGFVTAAIGIGLAASAAGSYMSYKGAQSTAKASRQAAEEQASASRQAEAARRQQMNLDALRKRRQSVREANVMRSQAMVAGVNQGAGGSSSLAGGIAQVTGDQMANESSIAQAQDIGGRIFDANSAYSEAGFRYDIARAKASTTGAWGSMLTSLGGMAVQNSGTIGRIGNFAFGRG